MPLAGVSDPTMDRRAVLQGGLVASTMLAGCLTLPDAGTPANGGRIALIAVDEPPAIPLRPAVEVVEPAATTEGPPRLRVTLTNTAEFPMEVGEERAIVFAYVHSQEQPGLQLLPEPAANYPAVGDGCWRLAEPIAIAEYYGIVRLAPGETTAADLTVWGSHDVGEGCLPTGRFRFLTAYTAARDETDGLDDAEFTARWGFSLEITR